MKAKIGSSLIIAGLVMGGLSTVSTIPAGHRGVLVQLGEVRPVVFEEGLNFKVPFIQSVIPIEVRIQKAESSQTAASRDMQNVSTTIAVNYSLNPLTVNDLYQNVGMEYKTRIVDPAIAEALKAITAQYTAEELITKRPEVSQKIKEALTEKLSKYNVVLEEISLTQFEFSEEFNRAIESKQTAEQNALKAERDLERIVIEKEQKITQAQAEAESLKLKKQEVTPELIRLKEIEIQEKALEIWDGKLPVVTGGATPFLDLNSLKDK